MTATAGRGTDLYEVAVVGGGPAGLSAAVAGGRMNRRTICFETSTPRTAHAPRYFNYLGFPEGISGRDLLALGRQQARRWGAELHDAQVTAVERVDDGEGGRFLLTTDAHRFRAGGVVFATGIRDLHPTCGTLYGEPGVHYCVVCDGYEVRGERVAVVGSDARALAMLRALRDFTPELHLLLDGAELEAPDETVRDLAAAPVQVHREALVRHRCGPDGVRFATGDGRELRYPHVFVALGVTPNTALAASVGCALDRDGYVRTDGRQATTVPFVYAAGDCDGGHKQVTQAMAEGEMAVLELARSLRKASGPALGSREPNPELAAGGGSRPAIAGVRPSPPPRRALEDRSRRRS